jgi:hypothetical protein
MSGLSFDPTVVSVVMSLAVVFFFGISFFLWLFASDTRRVRRERERRTAQTVLIGRRAHRLR